MNPFKWDYSSGKTWGYMAGGAITGGLSGGAANAIATSGMAFANTTALITGSFINSVGTAAYTGGKTDISVNFGFGSYNFSKGEFGYIGKKGNSFLENLGYGMGAFANLKDINDLINITDATLFTQETYEDGSKDFISHSGIVDNGTNENLMSFGPNSGAKIPGKIGFALEPKLGTVNYDVPQHLSKSIGIQVNKHAFSLARSIGKLLPYQGLTINCVNMSSLGLLLNGIPNIGLHPFLLHASMQAYSLGIRPDLFSHYLNR